MKIQPEGTASRIAMLLDNHYAPDNRVELEARVLLEAGYRVSIVAWDRTAGQSLQPPSARGRYGEDIARIHVPAPPGGGIKSLARMLQFAWRVLANRRLLLGDAAVIVVHDVYLLPLGWLLSHLGSTPLVYDAHEEHAVAEAGRRPPAVLRAVSSVETLLARHAAAVVVPGESRRARWIAVGIRPVVLANLGDFTATAPEVDPIYDITYCGILASVRRLDLLIELAQQRPDVRIVIAGRGRAESTVRAAAARLENLEFSGWVADPDSLLAASRSVYYGLDPAHPYAEKACPNTLYQAIRLRRPLVFFCGGEPATASARFRVGIRCRPTAECLAEAVDTVRGGQSEWEFESAWEQLGSEMATSDYVRLFEVLAPAHTDQPTSRL